MNSEVIEEIIKPIIEGNIYDKFGLDILKLCKILDKLIIESEQIEMDMNNFIKLFIEKLKNIYDDDDDISEILFTLSNRIKNRKMILLSNKKK